MYAATPVPIRLTTSSRWQKAGRTTRPTVAPPTPPLATATRPKPKHREGDMDGPDTSTHHIGLRFDKAEAGRIKRTAQLVRAFDAEAVGLLEKAYEAAISGAPLEVYCSHPSEALEVADDFPKRWSLKRPAVEAMNQPT